MATDNTSIKSFENANAWRRWLENNHAKEDGLWLQIFKKASNLPTVSYNEAVDESLCYGWIDGQKKKYDENSYLQKFTPRRPRSIWSKRNVEKVEQFLKEKKMEPAGLAEIEKAKADGRWDKAYDSPKHMKIPDDFITALKKDKKAYDFFKTLNKTNTYAIGFRLQTAKKAETRERRMKKILEMMKNEEKFH